MGAFYALLPKLGLSLSDGKRKDGMETHSLEEMKQHHVKINAVKKEFDIPAVLQGVPQRQCDKHLGVCPSHVELEKCMAEMKDSASGEDEVTLGLLRAAGPWLLQHLRILVRRLWTKKPEDVLADTYRGDLLTMPINKKKLKQIKTPLFRAAKEQVKVENYQKKIRKYYYSCVVVYKKM